MGLSIHYSGCIRKPSFLPEIIREVKEIAEIYKWDYTIFKEKFPVDSFDKESHDGEIYGIVFSPPNCEPVFITFLSNGKMSSPVNLETFGKASNEARRKYVYQLAVKTQYAGIHTHKLIIHLFRHLNNRYFQNFEMTDEGQYWETGDEELLQQMFDRYNRLIENFASALESYPMSEGETFESYFQKLINRINKRKGRSS